MVLQGGVCAGVYQDQEIGGSIEWGPSRRKRRCWCPALKRIVKHAAFPER
jgi:hypothetical protein